MRVYIVVVYSYDDTEILGVYASAEDALKKASEQKQIVQKEWEELWEGQSDEYEMDMLKEDPHDKVGVWDYEVQ